MRTYNALKVRNNLGEVLRTLEKSKKPIFITKGKIIRAVLITPEDFKVRFLDVQSEEEKENLLRTINSLKQNKRIKAQSLSILREIRGYAK